jgi:pimeloyl-ACP methyl ester carboxylesterase
VVSIERQATAVKPFLQQAESKKAILVGHSLGASVAVQTALDYPDKVGGLLLLAGAFDPDLEEANFIQLLGTFRPLAFLLPRDICSRSGPTTAGAVSSPPARWNCGVPTERKKGLRPFIPTRNSHIPLSDSLTARYFQLFMQYFLNRRISNFECRRVTFEILRFLVRYSIFNIFMHLLEIVSKPQVRNIF